jgi:hypothetical protein
MPRRRVRSAAPALVVPRRRARAAALVFGLGAALAAVVGCERPREPTPAASPAPPAPAGPRYVAVRAGDLPPGGEVRANVLYHTLRKGQTLSYLAERYLKFTDYYAVDELADAVAARNGLDGPARRATLGVGRELAIAEVRREPPDEPPRPREAPPGPEARAVYVTASTAGTGRVFELVRALKPLGLNTVVVDVKDSDGVVAYETRVALARETGADKNALVRDLPKLMRRLHDEGLRVVGRVAVFKDRWAARHARRLALNGPGGYYTDDGGLAWLDPSNPEARAYAVDLAREAVANGFDEVQFDYVRFPVVGDVRGLHYEGRGRGVPKHRVITEFVADAARAVHDAGRLVSIDVFGTVVWGEAADVERTGQRIADLAPHVDVLCPMVYPSHFHPGFHGHRYPAWEPYHFVSEGLRKMAAHAGERAPRPPALRPWLQAFPYRALGHFNADYVVEQLRGARDAGGYGFQLWDAKNDYAVAARGLAAWAVAPSPPAGEAAAPGPAADPGPPPARRDDGPPSPAARPSEAETGGAGRAPELRVTVVPGARDDAVDEARSPAAAPPAEAAAP